RVGGRPPDRPAVVRGGDDPGRDVGCLRADGLVPRVPDLPARHPGGRCRSAAGAPRVRGPPVPARVLLRRDDREPRAGTRDALGGLAQPGLRPRRHRWRRQRRRHARARHGRPAPARPDGPGAQLRARRGARRRRAARLPRGQGGLMRDAGFPLLTFIIFTPLAGAVLVALLPSRRTELVRAIGYATTAATLG